jgi:hypothetical protein
MLVYILVFDVIKLANSFVYLKISFTNKLDLILTSSLFVHITQT